MINQLQNHYTYSQAEELCIQSALGNWNSQRGCIIDMKVRLHVHCDLGQGERCCYCGLLYDRTGRGEIDHIAPKGINLYPQFAFEARNLAKACQLCNSSSMKHTYDSIATLSNVYDQCVFKIVHPYLDDHSQHYRWRYGLLRVAISVHNGSVKAEESIRLFELSSEKRTRARAIERNQERLNALYNISGAVKKRIMSVIRFKM